MTLWLDNRTRYGSWLIAEGASPGTARLYLNYLDRLAATVAPIYATVDDLIDFLGNPRWCSATRHSARNAIRSFYRWATLTGRRADDPSAILPKIRVPAGYPRPVPTSRVEYALDHANQRDRMLVLFACHGLRRAEISRVHTDDLIGDGGELLVRGKGGRARVIPLAPELLDMIGDLKRGYVFPGQIDGHLSPGHVGKVLARLLGDGYTAHTLRHRFATRAYAVDRDILAVQRLLGHSKLDTTIRYTAIPDGALRRAVLGAM